MNLQGISTWYHSINHTITEEYEFVFTSEIEFVGSFIRVSRMSFYGLRLEYALDGSSNHISWKDRMDEVLEDNRLKELIDNDIPKPPVSSATGCRSRSKLGPRFRLKRNLCQCVPATLHLAHLHFSLFFGVLCLKSHIRTFALSPEHGV